MNGGGIFDQIRQKYLSINDNPCNLLIINKLQLERGGGG